MPMAHGPEVHVSVQADDFDMGVALSRMQAGRHDVGALVSFAGYVRQWLSVETMAQPDASKPVCALELEHYPGMTERLLEAQAQHAAALFSASAVCIIHRVGRLALGEQIVLVAVAAAHRQAAFDACQYLMDWLKTQAPFWKREIQDGEGQWVASRASDAHSWARWQARVSDSTADNQRQGVKP